jgi:hypothetical protein
MAIVNGYATLPEIKAELRLTSSIDDARLERAVESASRVVDDICGREFFTTTSSTRVFAPAGDTVWLDDASALPTLVEQRPTPSAAFVVVAAAGYRVDSPPFGRPYSRLVNLLADWQPEVRVTAPWGWPAIPTPVKSATLIEAVRLFKRADTPEGVLQGEFGSIRMSRTDPDVMALCARYRKAVIG